MLKKIIFTGLFCSLWGAGFTFAQNKFVTHAQQYANEIYKDCPEYAGPAYMGDIREMLSRVEIRTEAVQPQENYDVLSNLILKNKCNPSLSSDVNNFNPDNFNPLKYFFNFYPKETVKYRVDGTQYVIVIQPKK